MIAICSIRPDPHYRREAFVKGLTKIGYRLVTKGRPTAKSDWLVLWNRQGAAEAMANTWEACGGTVIVVENGYIGRDAKGHQLYAIAVHGHNGSGWFPVGEPGRFDALGVELKPWHPDKGPILICGQRGIGAKGMASPRGWEEKVSRRVKGMNLVPRVRRHPGLVRHTRTLAQDLSDASHCLIWSSTSGVQALAMGVPVSYAAPHWIASGAARRGLEGLQNPLRDDEARLGAMRRLAWAQWTIQEIESGEPFLRIRERIGEATW